MLRLLTVISCFTIFSSAVFAQQRAAKYYHKNGVIKSEGMLLDGNKDGVWKYWNTDTVLIKKLVYLKGDLLKEDWFSAQGKTIKTVDGTLNPNYALAYTYKDEQLTSRSWLDNRNNKFQKFGGYEAYASDLQWYNSKEFKLWNYSIQTNLNTRYRYNSGFPRIDFYTGNTLKSIRIDGVVLSFNERGEIVSYTGPLDETEDIYSCSFRTYDGRVNVRKGSVAVERDIEVASFIGIASIDVKNGMPNGTWKAKYPHGKPMFVLPFKKGFVEGKYVAYYPNGQAKLQVSFAKDHAEGELKKWYANGQLAQEGSYKNGQMVGTWKSYSAEGKLLNMYTIYENSYDGRYVQNKADGKPQKEIFYDKGLTEGVAKEYGYTGNVLSETLYKRGQQVAYTEYNAKGGVKQVNAHTLRMMYHPNGQIQSVSYSDDFNDISVSLDSNGKGYQFRQSSGRKNSLYGYYRADTLYSYEYTIAGEKINVKPYDFIKEWPAKYKVYDGDVVAGKQQGEWVFYHPNKSVWMKGAFKDGLLEGKWTVYNMDGVLVAEHSFEGGLRQGAAKAWNGAKQLKRQENYANDLKSGEQKIWAEDVDVVVKIENYKNGLLDGYRAEFTDEGVIKREDTYALGLQNGVSKRYDEKKKVLKSTGEYKNGKRNGAYTVVDEKGNVLSETNFVEDKQHGKAKQYDGVGSLVKETLYYYGEIIETDEVAVLCDCEAGDNKLSSARYFPAVSDVAEWQSILFQLDGKIQLTKKLYDRTFYKQLQAGGSRYGSGSLSLVNRQEVSFEVIDNPGLKFVLNPCVKPLEFSVISLYANYDFPIGRMMGESFDPLAFEGTPRDYFDIGMKLREYTLRQFVFKYRYNVADAVGYSSAEIDVINKMKADFAKYELAPNYDWEELDIEKMVAAVAPQKEAFINMVFQEYFNVPSLDKENFPRDYRKFNESYRNYFGNGRELSSLEAVDQLFIKKLDVRFGNKQLAIDFPLALFTPVGQTTAIGDAQRARMVMKVTSFGYNLAEGLEVRGASNFCFAPAHFTGTSLSLEFSDAEVHYAYGYSETRVDRNIAAFCIKNKYTATKDIVVPAATGEWIDEASDSKFAVDYEQLYLHGEFVVGKIHVAKTKAWSPAIQTKFATNFDVYEIIENNDAGLTAYFIKSASFD